ncbi:FAD-dependent oxidoreductase [Streptomyces rectiverticillatus]|uniref:FAD-dependent oxidoreductase n=1 Tax=Streptomyces rectiverticillatus TaxID=173860 RepID=UPI0015C2E3A9|nr:FAD-dependent oxidoreductase [Streptomyces rectiverticillatus]QLE75375.1 FAD-dependent oxidoreductase [Streptomyces rectiverticillatus]
MDYDVVVAGAGPVGLTLACELRLAGVSVLVVERRTAIDTTIKAGAINTPSAEAFYRRGLLPALAAIQQENLARISGFMAKRHGADGAPPKMPPKFAGHFAGIALSGDLLDVEDPDFAEAGPAGDVGFVPQEPLERLLGERAAELGAEVRRGVELTGFDADDDGVTVRAEGSTIRAGWLVGCDGGRSTVRKLGGFTFPGTEPSLTGHQAMVEMEGAEALGAGWNWTDTGTYAHGPFPGRILTVEFDGPPADRDAPVTAEELQASLRHVSGTDVTVTAVHTATRFTDNARQAAGYRRGRVLLAGDAAHVHSPFGGQGLNLGIGDAMNLGWKLAATVRGWAPEGLLDTYTAERHPLGAWVLEWTRAQVALMRPESHARALREVVAEFSRTVAGTTFFAKKISGVWQRYEAMAGPGDHPLVGRSAPDLALADGSRLADHLHEGRALLLDLADAPGVRAAAEGFGDRVRVVTAPAPARPELTGLLVRPDGFTAWAAEAGSPAGAAGLDSALLRWFGERTTTG